MATRVVEVRKNITLFKRINASSTFSSIQNSVNIMNNVSFIPDEVIIKGILYNPDANESAVTTLYCDFLSDTIGSFYENIYITPNLQFKLDKPVNSVWNFVIIDYTGLANAGRVGEIVIHFEFIKYQSNFIS